MSRNYVHTALMDIRERWISEISCPECGVMGTAGVSEEDHPYETGDLGRAVFFCTPGFDVVPTENSDKESHIVCSKCKAIVVYRKKDLSA